MLAAPKHTTSSYGKVANSVMTLSGNFAIIGAKEISYG